MYESDDMVMCRNVAGNETWSEEPSSAAAAAVAAASPTVVAAPAPAPAPAFSIDVDPRVCDAERTFLANMSAFQIGENNMRSVALYSRALDRTVQADFNQFTTNALAPLKTGHTLAIDYTRTYVRYMAFDVDCMCRKNKTTSTSTSTSTATATTTTTATAAAAAANLSATSPQYHYATPSLPDAPLSAYECDGEGPNCIKPVTIDAILVDLKSILMTSLNLNANATRSNSSSKSNPNAPQPVAISTWRNGCGYHIYTNVCVTLPTHHHVYKLLKARLINDGSNMAYRSTLIELPDMMPLPYSAKVYGRPYSARTYADTTTVTMFVPRHNEPCYELLKSVPCDARTSVQARIFSPVGEKMLIAEENPSLGQPVALGIVTVYRPLEAANNHQLTAYMGHLTARNRASCYTPIEPKAIDFVGFKYAAQVVDFLRLFNTIRRAPNYRNAENHMRVAHETYTTQRRQQQQQQQQHGGYRQRPVARTDYTVFEPINSVQLDLDTGHSTVLDDLDAPNVEVIDGSGSHIDTVADCSTYLDLAIAKNFGMDLQHYVVAMHKYIMQYSDEQVDIGEFRAILEHLFELHMAKISVHYFVKNYNDEIVKAYTDSYRTILTYLQFAESNHMLANRPLKLAANEFLIKAMGVQPQTIEAKKSEELQNFFAYVEEFVRMTRMIIVNRQSERVYAFENTRYTNAPKLELKHLNTDMTTWLSHSALNDLIDRLMAAEDGPSMSRTPFQHSTTLGVYNAMTCQYVSHSPLLRFTTYRGPIFSRSGCSEDQTVHDTVYETLNEELLNHLTLSQNVVGNYRRLCSKIFARGFMLPALISMSEMYELQQIHMKSMLERILTMDCIDELVPLVELYALKPSYIVLLSQIAYDRSPYEFSDYAQLCFNVFKGTGSVEEWRRHFPAPVVTPSDDMGENDALGHLQKLKSICVNGVPLAASDEVLVLYTMIGVFISKCKAYANIGLAFPHMMPPRNQIVEMDDVNTRVDPSQHKVYLATVVRDTIAQVLHPKTMSQSVYYLMLTYELISLCVSMNFNMERLQSLLDTLSMPFVAFNFHKKIVIYYGMGNVGKSLLCSKLYDYILHSAYQVRDLHKAMSRSHLTTESIITILHEVQTLYSGDIKSVSGNDNEDVARFYTQKMERTHGQAFIYGATNINIQFDRRHDVDRTTVDRIYMVEFTGKVVSGAGSNMFGALMSNNYLMGLYDQQPTTALGMLSLANYVMRRRPDYYPVLQENSDTERYRDKIYFLNNALYRVIVGAQFVYHDGFYAPIATFKAAVRTYLNSLNEESSSSSSSSASSSSESKKRKTTNFTFESFSAEFNQQYNIDLLRERDGVLNNFQQSALIKHIKMNMSTIVDPHENITSELLEHQLSAYSVSNNRDNALNYFDHVNSARYDKVTQTYRGVAFKCPMSTYDDTTNSQLSTQAGSVAETLAEQNVSAAIAILRGT